MKFRVKQSSLNAIVIALIVLLWENYDGREVFVAQASCLRWFAGKMPALRV
jgi:hypothetical protein